MDAGLDRRGLRRRAGSISLALVPFGTAFGVTAAQAGLTPVEALGFSSLVFTGGAQFAAVSVLGAGGSAVAAVLAGLLLNLRCLAFGVVMAPVMHWRLPARAAASQLMIDEAVAVGTVSDDPALRRYGYLAGGLGVFATWNASTLLGVLVVPSTGSVVTDLGLDATIPAAFLALLWPRLADPAQRRTALGGLLLAVVLVPLTPPGVPVIAASLAVGLALVGGPRPVDPREDPGMTRAAVVLLVLAAGTYLLKAAGPLLLGGRTLPAGLARVVVLLPAALLAALVATSTVAVGRELVLDARLPALLAAGVALALRAPFLVVVAVAAVTAAGLRLLT